MKRSEVNQIIEDAKEFFDHHQFRLPEWATWSPEQWKGSYKQCAEIIDNQLGWDITDFGSGDFAKTGLMLFTIRNGNWNKQDKTYCEKIMIADENQETPMHFHWKKMEDIINRGGGNLVMELYKATEEGALTDHNVNISIDGVENTFSAGEKVILKPGQSITLKPHVYHRFYGEERHGKVLIGEVSTVNDDANDNRFYQEIGRFPDIEEDEPPIHLLISDYKKYL